MTHDSTLANPERKRARRIESETPRVETLIGESGAGSIHPIPLLNNGAASRDAHRHGTPGSSSELMTLEQAAVAAGVSVRTLARYRKSGALEVVKFGRRVLCSLDAIQRALVRRSLQQLWREITEPSRDGDPLSAWLQDLQALAETSPNFERPDLHRAFVNETLQKYGSTPTREFRVSELSTIQAALSARGVRLETLRLLATFPHETPVIDALRSLHLRFGL